MQAKNVCFMIGFLLIFFFAALLSCATDQAPLQIVKTLPQSEIAYYNDPFDKMREDLWDRAGFLYREEQMQNFKQADMRFENGKLIIQTQTGSFSKGGLATRYGLRGDFDIQLDCHMDFIKGVSSMDMDQVLSFGVYDQSTKFGEMAAAIIGLSMKGGLDQGYIFSNCFKNGEFKRGGSHKTENFNGSFRIVRTGKDIHTFYKNNGATPEWTKMTTYRLTDGDMMMGFQLRNFFAQRTSLQASYSISVEFDQFKITAAQQIIEEEI